MSLLREAMTAGVFVEFLDAAGNCQGQAVFVDWRGRPLPGVGDTLSADVASAGDCSSRKLTGVVVTRHFELQRDAADRTEVWARLVVQTEPMATPRRLTLAEFEFSDN